MPFEDTTMSREDTSGSDMESSNLAPSSTVAFGPSPTASTASANLGNASLQAPQRPFWRRRFWDSGEKRSLKAWQASFVLIAGNISLGVLCLPTTAAKLGVIPAFVFMCVMCAIQWYTGLVVHRYTMLFPDAQSFADLMAMASKRMVGSTRPGRLIGLAMQSLYLLLVMAAHISAFANMLTVFIGNESLCRLFTAAAGAGLMLSLTVCVQLGESTWLSVASSLSILGAVVVCMSMIATEHPHQGDWYALISGAQMVPSEMCSALSTISLSFSGHTMYPSINNQMKAKKDFPKALAGLMVAMFAVYGLVISIPYVYAGSDVESPFFSSVSPFGSKVSYGCASLTIVVAGVIAAYVVANGLNEQLWRQRGEPDRAHESGKGQWTKRLIQVLIWLFACFLAVAIPIFGHILGLMGALFGTSFGLLLPSVFWWDMARKNGREAISTCTWRRGGRVALMGAVPIIGLILMIIGVYGSVVVMKNSSVTTKPFSCRNPPIKFGQKDTG